MSHKTYTKDDLRNLRRSHGTFVGIDSDGCVFDTMEIKQKQCFHPVIVRHWKLEPIERYVREAAEFVNLYSKWRGQNRFPCLVLSIDLLRDRPEVLASGVRLPEFRRLREWMASGVPMGNPTLEAEVRKTGDAELTDLLAWSNAVNEAIEQTVKQVPPFPWCSRSLPRIVAQSDMIVVSQTPTEALVREWEENGILDVPQVIAGQELGSKSEHLALAAQGHYPADRILMIGDAPGDRKAAESVQANNGLGSLGERTLLMGGRVKKPNSIRASLG
jgi:phosphoglycolate phosphatase-like HAD superfamily hydrolase